jgi:hypothetical protein
LPSVTPRFSRLALVASATYFRALGTGSVSATNFNPPAAAGAALGASLAKARKDVMATKEAGIKVGSTYLLEGINQVNYQKPNKITEKVLSNRNNLPAVLRNADAPNLRVTQTNFYSPKIWGYLISPVAPNAFQFYKFAYIGSFTVNGQTISKIQITPKSSYQDLFEGVISVVEDTWSIYSFSLNFKNSSPHNAAMLSKDTKYFHIYGSRNNGTTFISYVARQ